MRLTEKQKRFYQDNGYLFLTDVFASKEISEMQQVLPAIFAKDDPARVLEKDGHTVRSVYGCHTTTDVFSRLVRDSRLLEPAEDLIGSKLYVYQFKVNVKAAFSGDVWQWHQDFIFWREGDGMPQPDVLTVAIFLDDVTELNGPIFLVPGSHREGVVEPRAAGEEPNNDALRLDAYSSSPTWISNLTATLKYTIDQRVLAEMISRYGTVAPKGPAGSVLFFHSNLAHGSGTNISPQNRILTLITYNSVKNVPNFPENRRPEFLASSDARPLEPLEQGAGMAAVSGIAV